MWPFKKKTPPISEFGLAALSKKMNISLTPHSCDKCGKTFLVLGRQMDLISFSTPTYQLDVGGFCNVCQKWICQQHCKYVSKKHVLDKYRFLLDPEAIKNAESNPMVDSTYLVVCEACEIPVESVAKRF